MDAGPAAFLHCHFAVDTRNGVAHASGLSGDMECAAHKACSVRAGIIAVGSDNADGDFRSPLDVVGRAGRSASPEL